MKLIECPRDAMQGIQDYIPSELKAEYINTLLKVGFDTIDFGSFVSPKAIPQLKDTAEVLLKLELGDSRSKLLAIVANERGARDASEFEEISYLGFPFSISETFQLRNTNKTIDQALNTLRNIQEICIKNNKVLVSYISMGFGNPYNDPFDVDLVSQYTQVLVDMGIKIISLADTIGVSNVDNIDYLYSNLIPKYTQVEFGAHLHSNPGSAIEKIEAAYQAGCRRFDGAIKGYGGCPMAEDNLVGNIATEKMLSHFGENNLELGISKRAFGTAHHFSSSIFDQFH